MQREETINSENIGEIIDAVFVGEPEIYEADSAPDEELKSFSDKSILMDYISNELAKGYKFISFGIYYPDAGGVTESRVVNLNPEKCDGATKRYSFSGWGIVFLQMTYQEDKQVSCRVTVNSQKRASSWESTYPELKSADLWDWKLVEKHARRLIRVLKKCT